MVELAFLAAAVALVYRSLLQIKPKANPQPAATARPASSAHPSAPVKRPHSQLISTLEYAEKLYNQKKFLAAEKAYLAVLKADHKHVGAYRRLGLIYGALHNYPEAIECFQAVCQLQPEPANLVSLGFAYQENKNYLKAIAAFEKANAAQPTAAAYIGLGRTYQKLTNNFKAVLSFEKAAEIDPSARHLQLLAEVYLANRDKVKARQTYERILAIDPNNVRARQALAPLADKLDKTAS